MRKSIKILMGMLPVFMVLMASCGNDDNPELPTTSLVRSYVEPSYIELSESTQGKPTDLEHAFLGPSIFIKGEVVTAENSPVRFAEISRSFGDTAYSANAKGFWLDWRRDNFLAKPLLGLKFIAADDSWSNKYPKGSDVSELFRRVHYRSAQPYIDSGYQDVAAINAKELECLADWKPEYGYSVYFNFAFEGPVRLATLLTKQEGEWHTFGSCEGHDYIVVATFPDGTITSKVFRVWCPAYMIPA